ncbi:MAG: ribosome maturation factor RimM, partial [Clostridiales bacterium]|nr:ribosome maturation factor RimM [Clostridiales bacterium]
MEDYLQVGIITKAHGVRGEVSVFPTTDDPKRFKKLKTVLLETRKGQRMQMKITSVKFSKNMAILKFEGIDDMDTAETYREAGLFVTREQAVPLGEDEWFIADMYGLTVITDDGEELGELADVLQTGANDVYA